MYPKSTKLAFLKWLTGAPLGRHGRNRAQTRAHPNRVASSRGSGIGLWPSVGGFAMGRMGVPWWLALPDTLVPRDLEMSSSELSWAYNGQNHRVISCSERYKLQKVSGDHLTLLEAPCQRPKIVNWTGSKSTVSAFLWSRKMLPTWKIAP